MHEKALIIKEISDALMDGLKDQASIIINNKYPFKEQKVFHRNYTIHEKMNIFIRDGFIDRYSGERLIIPGMLKVISNYFPYDFPYHPHWKMTDGHMAYWELIPTVDHLIPIAAGGIDEESNWVTTSMLNNSVKSNWTLEQLRWTLYSSGDIKEWDGLSHDFISIVEKDNKLLEDNYISNWYKIAKKCSDT